MTDTLTQRVAEWKPCPFCGGEAFLISAIKISQQSRYAVRCRDCMVETPSCSDASHIQQAWNTRHEASGAQHLQGLVEALKKAGAALDLLLDDFTEEEDDPRLERLKSVIESRKAIVSIQKVLAALPPEQRGEKCDHQYVKAMFAESGKSVDIICANCKEKIRSIEADVTGTF